jgi:hypothetical protein
MTSPWEQTAGFIYVRGHGPGGRYREHYSGTTLTNGLAKSRFGAPPVPMFSFISTMTKKVRRHWTRPNFGRCKPICKIRSDLFVIVDAQRSLIACFLARNAHMNLVPDSNAASFDAKSPSAWPS